MLATKLVRGGHTPSDESVQAQRWGVDWISLGCSGGLLAVVVEPLCSLGVGEEGVARSSLGGTLEWCLGGGDTFKNSQ